MRRRLHFIFHPFIFYCVIMFLFSMGDMMMSYVSPIYIENSVHSTLLMGIVMSFSSVVGLICDTYFPYIFKNRSNLFFLKYMLLTALIFPLLFLIDTQHILFLLTGMAVWGVYYEFKNFSNYHAVEAFTNRSNHAFSWSLLGAFQAIAFIIGPLLAAYLYDQQAASPLYTAIIFFIAGLIGFSVFKLMVKPEHQVVKDTKHKNHSHFWSELKVWRAFLKTLWPIYLFIVAIMIIDAALFTVGILLSEEMQLQSPLGYWLLPIYMFPQIAVAPVVKKISNRFGKKRTAFISGAVSGLLLVGAGLSSVPWIFVSILFLSSILTSIALPNILGAMEDYVERVHESREELIGLGSSTTSVSYIIGPILSGFIAEMVGNYLTFSVVGGILAVTSVVALIVVPRKVKLPQKVLTQPN